MTQPVKLSRMIGGTEYVGMIVQSGEGYQVALHRIAYTGKQRNALHLPAYDYHWPSEDGARGWVKACFSNIAIADAVGNAIAKPPAMQPQASV